MVMALSRIQLALCFSHVARSGPVGGISIAIVSPISSKRIVFVAAASVNSKRLRNAEIITALCLAVLSFLVSTLRFRLSSQ
ncbi:MAG: hypothetical protein WBP90_01635, partial [Terracidiphilus sp.]